MSYHFTMKSLEDINFEQKYKTNIENTIHLPKKLGYMNIKDTKINEDIFLFKMDQKINENITIDCKIQNLFYINIVLSGNHIIKSNEYHTTAVSKKGNTAVSFINEDKGFYLKEGKNPFKSIGIVIKGDFLEKNFFSKVENKKNMTAQAVNIFKNETTSIQTQICANQLFCMQENNTLSNIYKESRVLDIIYNEFNDILNTYKQPDLDSVKFDEYDIQALYKAKEILLSNIQNPPSIKELSKLVHLNEFKLKKGFKKKFNITPYKLLEQHKMETAKYLLENEEMNINEIAEYLGYKYQSNFSNLFKKYYQVNPKELMKTRKYYY